MALSRSSKVQLVVLGVNIVFWGGILGYVATAEPGDPPGYLDDRAYPAAAEPICAVAMAEVATFGNGAAVESIEERADLVDRQDVVFRRMLSELADVPAPDGEQGGWVREWLDDWSTHVDDRQRWAGRLHAGVDPPFVETAKHNEQISEAIDFFAETNQMPSCATLNDV